MSLSPKLFSLWIFISFFGYHMHAQCTTQIGTLLQGNLFICQNDTILGNYLGDHILDPDDTLLFILHNNDIPPLGVIYAMSDQPKFTFVPGQMVPGFTYYITAIAGDANPFGINTNDPCLSISESIEVVFAEQPFAFLSGPDVWCANDVGDLIVTLPTTGTYDFTYTDGIQDFTLNGISNPHTININPSINTTYTGQIIASQQAPFCEVALDASSPGISHEVIVVGPGPSVTDINWTCTDDREGIIVDFYINDGSPATYSVVGNFTGQLIGNHFISQPIPNGLLYEFQVGDEFNCLPVLVSGSEVCPCISQVGLLNALPNDPGIYCVNNQTNMLYDPGSALVDGNDTLVFILHKDLGLPGDPLNLIATNNTPVFGFDPATMTDNQIYYISAAVVSVINGQIDYNHLCISYSAPMPVSFYNLSGISITSDPAICAGSSANVDLLPVGYGPFNVVISNGTTDFQFDGLTGAQTVQFTPASTTTYNLVELIDSLSPGCYLPQSISFTIQVDQPNQPGIAAAPPVFCSNQATSVTLSDYLTGETDGGQWSASPQILALGGLDQVSGVVNLPALPLGSFGFSYTLSPNGACLATGNTVNLVHASSPIAIAGIDKTLNCQQEPVLIGSVSVAPIDIYSWFFDGQLLPENILPAIMTDQPGTYELWVEDPVYGCLSKDTVVVFAGSTNLESEFFSIPLRCHDGQSAAIHVTNILNGSPPYAYSINQNPLQPMGSFINLGAGTYNIFMTDSLGCTLDTTFFIENPPKIELSLTPQETIITRGETVVFSPALTGGVGTFDVTWTLPDTTWTTDVLDPLSLTPFITTQVTLHVVDELGCQASEQALVFVNVPRDFFVPTVMNPHSTDINNNHFTIYGGTTLQLIEELSIFARDGALLFKLSDFAPGQPELGWDGTHRGEFVSPGVYSFHVVVRFDDGLRQKIKGSITVVR